MLAHLHALFLPLTFQYNFILFWINPKLVFIQLYTCNSLFLINMCCNYIFIFMPSFALPAVDMCILLSFFFSFSLNSYYVFLHPLAVVQNSQHHFSIWSNASENPSVPFTFLLMSLSLLGHSLAMPHGCWPEICFAIIGKPISLAPMLHFLFPKAQVFSLS